MQSINLEKQRQQELYEKHLLTERENALEKGIEIGKEKGIEIGKEKGLIEVAKKMKVKGLDISLIIETTGLDKETIEKL